MLESQLSKNFLRDVIVMKKSPQKCNVQILCLKKTHQKGDPTAITYKLSINDGESSYNAFLHSHFNKYIEEKRIKQYTIIKITKYTSKIFGLHHSFIILGFEVIDNTIDHIIGDPKQICSQPESQKLSESQPCLPEVFHLISNLSPYIFNWTIRARVVQKSPIKTYRTINGQKRSFSIIVKDINNDEIEASFYDGDIDHYFELIIIDNVYSFSGGSIIQNSHKYSSSPNDYSIKFGNKAKIIEVPDLGDIGFLSYNYKTLAEIAAQHMNSVDFIGVVVQINPIEKIDSKFRTNISKRVVELCDQSNLLVDLTLWDEQADNFPESGNFVISLKGAKITKFKGIALSSLSTTLLEINRDCEETRKLQVWYESAKTKVIDMEKLSSSSSFIYPIYSFSQAAEMFNKDAMYHTAYCYITEIILLKKLFYCACPNPLCRGKGLYSPEPDLFLCERCHQRIEHPRYRYAFSFDVTDDTGSIRVSLLGNDILGEKITGYPINEWVEKAKDMNEVDMKSLLYPNLFTLVKLKLRTKLDNYNARVSVESSVIQGEIANFGDAALHYAQLIESNFC